ncbi:hypothetical protein PHELEMICH_26 [Mycobacterium phage Phelemich]|nr:tail assembly chaperone [Mycobacterium phage Phelemich]AGT13940.1 hypothetical protein PHELEMICH_26 [Mycobacterium phage Phelemich]
MTTFNADGSREKAHSLPEPEPDPSIQLEPPVDCDIVTDDGETTDTASVIADLATDEADDPRKPVDGEVIDAEPVSTAVALVPKLDVSTIEKWDHDWLQFKGDKLGIRVPTRQALAAFSLASGKYVDIGVKNDLTGLFIARHLSPESYGRVFSRLMDPDEVDYTVDTVGELFNAIVTASLQPEPGTDKQG